MCTMDREADFLDLFIERRAHAPQVELLVRAKVDRVLGKDEDCRRAHGLGAVCSTRCATRRPAAPAKVEVRRLSARAEGQQTGPQGLCRADRVAELTLRYQGERCRAPAPSRSSCLSSMRARSSRRPGSSSLEWFVLTTLRVTSPDDATRILGWYALRWRIEEYFRVLKSGCKVEELQHHTAERLERAMAIKMVVGSADPVDGATRARGA